jgi:acetolactate synthase-1/2/3 large subunit
VKTGADALVETLLANGVTTCFANPGTSELPFVESLDRHPRMRAILCLFEGVATGAADGYGRMAGMPAATLLHLGPGYANGIANLHNARRAATPVVNVIGDHAVSHRPFDAPLASDIAGLAAVNSVWVGTIEHAHDVAARTAEAVRASRDPLRPGPASLILPADVAWNPSDARPATVEAPGLPALDIDAIDRVAQAIRAAQRPALLIGGSVGSEHGLAQAARLAGFGMRVFIDTFVARQARGAGVFAPERVPYFVEAAQAALAGTDLLVMCGTRSPVIFFASPGQPGSLVPPGCETLSLAENTAGAIPALTALADSLHAVSATNPAPAAQPAAPAGALTPATIGATIARHLPANAVIAEDAATSGGPVRQATAGAARHEWLALTGGSIGAAIPVALGAAIAAPDRKVVALTGDGAAAYTFQGLWSLAREGADVTVVVFANRRYRILDIELQRSGGNAAAAASLFSLADPAIDWPALAASLGVESERCDTAEAFERGFAASMTTGGPRLIEAII